MKNYTVRDLAQIALVVSSLCGLDHYAPIEMPSEAMRSNSVFLKCSTSWLSTIENTFGLLPLGV